MALSLARHDFLTVGPISASATMALLPPGKKKKNRVAVGDDTGSITCFEMKKGVPTVAYKTIPQDTGVAAVALGGPPGKKDRVFASLGQEIRGYNRKGKEFFKFMTNLTETITTMRSESIHLWSGAEYIYNQFDDGKDVHFYMAPDKINALTVGHITRSSQHDAILACQDSQLRVIQDSDCVLEASVEGPATAVEVYEPSLQFGGGGGGGGGASNRLLYGTRKGHVGMMHTDSDTIRPVWVHHRSGPTMEGEGRGTSQVTAITSYDLTKDGVSEVVIGRDDGTLQVLGIGSEEPEVLFQQNMGESIRSVEVGQIATPGFDEVAVATYSGRVIGFTTESLGEKDTQDSYGRSKDTVEREAQIVSLQKDLEALEVKLKKEKEKFSKMDVEYLPMGDPLKVNASFHLDAEEAAYTLAIEIPLPIDIVAIDSNVDADLMDVDKSAAIMSRTPGMEGNALLATYRCQDNHNRLEIKMRTIEGVYGDLNVTVVGKAEPKTAQTLSIPIKPLSLHYRISEGQMDQRVLNKMMITGPFSLAQMHEWISTCVPDMPPRAPSDVVTLYYRNAYLGSLLTLNYRKGEAEISSDSVSAVAILKEVITKQATERKLQLNLSFDIKKETIPAFIKLVHPRLLYTLSLAKKIDLIEALKEIKQQGEDTSFLSPEYKEILENAETIKKEFEHRPRQLQMLCGLITDLFVDYFKFQGRNVQSRIPDLMRILQDYDFDRVVRFFQEA